jgi:hypothetical protein
MLARQVLYHMSHSASPMLGIFKVGGSHELFALSGFEP